MALRNEEEINSTRNETDLLAKCFLLPTFSMSILFTCFFQIPNWFSTCVSDDRKYVCGRRLYACINTRKFKGLDHHCQISKKWCTWHVFSIITKNKSHAHCIQWKFTTPNLAILLIQILIFFRPLSSVHLLQSNQRFQAIEFVDWHVSEKLLI